MTDGPKLYPYQQNLYDAVMRGDIVRFDRQRRDPGKSVYDAYAEAYRKALGDDMPRTVGKRAELAMGYGSAMAEPVRKKGWANWHVNRGRLPLNPTDGDLRRISWRRTF